MLQHKDICVSDDEEQAQLERLAMEALPEWARKEIETLRAALQAGEAVQGWQSIATAPKDGTAVDLWAAPYTGSSRRFTNYWWLESEQVWRTDCRVDILPGSGDPFPPPPTEAKAERELMTLLRSMPVSGIKGTNPLGESPMFKISNITEERRLEIALTVLAQLGGLREQDLSESTNKIVKEACEVVSNALNALPVMPSATQAHTDAKLLVIADMSDTIRAYNEVLRSTMAIARRGGKNTNWPAFMETVEMVLNHHHATWLSTYSWPPAKA